MKGRILSALLITCLAVTGLTACGSSGSDSSSGNTGDSSKEEESSDSEGASEIEAMELTLTTSKNESSDSAPYIQYFCDYVTEASGGVITFNIAWGGTLCGITEEFDFVSSGSADICFMNPLYFSESLPLTQLPNATCNGYEGTAEYAEYLLLDNEETASMVQKNFEDNNMHFVGVTVTGMSGYYTNKEAYSLEDLAAMGARFGTSQAGTLESSYGLNIISMQSSEAYDNLSRAVIDVTDGSLISNYTSYIQEVTDYWISYQNVNYGNYISINLDKWNSWSEEVQNIFTEAGKATLWYSIEYISEQETIAVEDVTENNGVTVTIVEDNQDYALESYTTKAENALLKTQGTDAAEDMKTLISCAAEYLEYDLSDLLAKY